MRKEFYKVYDCKNDRYIWSKESIVYCAPPLLEYNSFGEILHKIQSGELNENDKIPIGKIDLCTWCMGYCDGYDLSHDTKEMIKRGIKSRNDSKRGI